MLFYYLFWMITGFIIHFYITFGTNLLTGGPAHIVVLLPVSVFRRKGISNVVQTEWNLRQRDFLEEYDPGDLEFTSEDPRGGNEGGGAPPLLGMPPCLVATPDTVSRWFHFPKIINIPKKITFPKVSFRLDSVWYPFPSKHWNRQKNSNLGWASG